MAVMIKSRLIQENPELLSVFLKQFETLSGIPVELDYLQRAKVRGFFKEGELVAGFVSNTTAPLRCVAWIPHNVRRDLISEKFSSGENSCCELTCLWKDHSRVTPWEMNWIYISAVFDGLFSGKRNIVGCTFVRKLAKEQTRIFSQILYSGPSEFDSGKQCTVYFGTRFHVFTGIIREFLAESKKEINRRAVFRTG